MPAREYDLSVEEQLRSATDGAVAAARVGAGHRVLDVCCGTGNAAHAALAAGAAVTGVDLDEGAIRAARARLPDAELEVADALDLPFPDDSFDAAVSVFGVAFLPGERAARELRRVVREGGRVAVTAWPREGSVLSAGGILRRAVLEAQGRPAVLAPPTAWHDRETVRRLFAPHPVEFEEEEIVFSAASAIDVASQYYDRHRRWLAAREVIGDRAYRRLRERAIAYFEEVNEDPQRWRATDRFFLATATVGGRVSG